MELLLNNPLFHRKLLVVVHLSVKKLEDKLFNSCEEEKEAVILLGIMSIFFCPTFCASYFYAWIFKIDMLH